MNNSSWIINKAGLIDFWYYDQQEFSFLDGRMLLRGSNGSGKSVTMQSFIPLLLDGNMRPERLDPFGSRARKMENYLLEEDDSREERTGYLYMELKRQESDTYITIGMGMRARKNKKLETWYFCITDGRRIGIDFWLYKDVQNKIAYSKTELRNRIGDGGRVMDSQNEYASCVNSLIFGFETIEEYKEMLDLLIQLRTPKLSKDFKPSVINDILSKSLQTLSEDDLRPMSEAIENMDTLKTNLDNISESIKAAKQIEKVYDQYNKAVLLNRAESYLKTVKEFNTQQKELEAIEEGITRNKEELEKEKELYDNLKREYVILEKERDSLSNNDATRLKAEENKLEGQAAEYEKEIENYEKRSDKKREECIEKENRIKTQKDTNNTAWQDLDNTLVQMEETVEDIPFDEAFFFIEEIKSKKESRCDFNYHAKMLNKYIQKVEEGTSILRQEEEAKRHCDEALRELDLKQEERDKAEREWHQYDRQLIEQKSEITEAVYIWERGNTELHMEPLSLQEIAGFIDNYQYGMDYSRVSEILRSQKNKAYDILYTAERKLIQEKEPLTVQLAETEEELKTWEKSREPEPERSQEVVDNRKKLDEMGIKYIPFYKAVDFEESLSSEKADKLEAALYHMGILDALIVDADNRNKILGIEGNICDKYLFSDIEHVKPGIMEVIQVYNAKDDIILYQQISNVLSGIGYYSKDVQPSTWAGLEGHYRIGVLEGTTGTGYKAKYIGAAAKERYRSERIEELKKQIDVLEKQIKQIEWDILKNKEQQKTLQEEMDKFPDAEDLKIAAKDLWDSKSRLDTAKETKYWSGVGMLKTLEDSLEGLIEDRDEILYTLNQYNQRKARTLGELESVRQQLGLTNYNEIKERLDTCVKRLGEIPGERDRTASDIGFLENSIENDKEKMGRKQEQISNTEQLKNVEEQIFQMEYSLGYVMPDISGGETNKPEDAEIRAKNVCNLLGGQDINKIQLDSIHGNLQTVFHEKKGLLAEYQLSIYNLFEEQRKVIGRQELIEKYGIPAFRPDIKTKYRGMPVSFKELVVKLNTDMEDLEKVLSAKDRELFEDILSNTISKKIRAKIYESKRWVEKMNSLMESMQTSSGLKLSLKWISKKTEKEGQLDTKELVNLLQSDTEILRQEDIDKMSSHFRSKIMDARKLASDTNTAMSFHMIMKDILDYRQWFEFQLYSQKTGEKKKELTDRVFFTFSGGEKAMSMYVPLFSAVVAKYAGANKDAPLLISLDEAFAGVDEMNIKDMFRLMVSLNLNFMINSQVLWGDYETVPGLAIYQLVRPENAKFVTVVPYVWNGKTRVLDV
ncbi:MAG: TIGR02680 family protein [Lachnospiraceae bacterium]|nr:TIGR02680 family protein [Lachnospiraceae bacterium]